MIFVLVFIFIFITNLPPEQDSELCSELEADVTTSPVITCDSSVISRKLIYFSASWPTVPSSEKVSCVFLEDLWATRSWRASPPNCVCKMLDPQQKPSIRDVLEEAKGPNLPQIKQFLGPQQHSRFLSQGSNSCFPLDPPWTAQGPLGGACSISPLPPNPISAPFFPQEWAAPAPEDLQHLLWGAEPAAAAPGGEKCPGQTETGNWDRESWNG